MQLSLLFKERYQHLRTVYEPPRNLKEVSIYWKEIQKTDNFRTALKNRGQFGCSIALFDVSIRYAMFYYFVGGYWSGFGGVNTEFPRKIIPTFMAALITSPLSHPFEVARAALIADQTFPKELQKGYTSYWNCLRRLPFEEGPYYMFRGIMPTVYRNTAQTFTFFWAYDFFKDCFWPLEFENDYPHEVLKPIGLFIAASVACATSYPLGVLAKWNCEHLPIAKGETKSFQGNYRIAMRDLWYNDTFVEGYKGFSKTYYWRTWPWMFISGWIADDMGLFAHWKTDYNTYSGMNSHENLLE